MDKIRVGIDVDEVLRDFFGAAISLAQENGTSVTRPARWDFVDTYKVDGTTIRDKIWGTKEWLEEIYLNADVLPFAKKGYDKFIEDDDFEVYIVSTQFNETIPLTDQWLEKNGFTKHKDVIYTFDKLEAPCQLLIDDKPSHIQEYKDNVRDGFLVSCEHNMHTMMEPKVKNLVEAYELAKKTYLERVA